LMPGPCRTRREITVMDVTLRRETNSGADGAGADPANLLRSPS
jgi:hypothetical protein